ncbi:hypothetical protein NCTGTJJY_CDS0010 [Serratia phage 92A1]|nr:hypothetical protein NCTGTJJY_CDS0010 [Serratia phage 92A1]
MMRTQVIRFKSNIDRAKYAERHKSNAIVEDYLRHMNIHGTAEFTIAGFSSCTDYSIEIVGVPKVQIGETDYWHITPMELRLFTTYSEHGWSTGHIHNPDDCEFCNYPAVPEEEILGPENVECLTPVQLKEKVVKVKIPAGVTVSPSVHINKTIGSAKSARQLIEFLQSQFGL